MVQEDISSYRKTLQCSQRYDLHTKILHRTAFDTVSFKLFITAAAIWGFAVSTVKISILIFYHRIFSFNNRTFTAILWTVGAFIVCYCLTQSIASILACLPVRSNWTPGMDHYCVNIPVAATIIASCNVLSDIVILILPMPLLYRLQKPLGQKLQIMGIFLLGGL